MDENDNAPVFRNVDYVTELNEGPKTVGVTIATVTAIDPDEGLNGTLRYAIASGNLMQTFNINSITVRHRSCYADEFQAAAGKVDLVFMLCLFRG